MKWILAIFIETKHLQRLFNQYATLTMYKISKKTDRLQKNSRLSNIPGLYFVK